MSTRFGVLGPVVAWSSTGGDVDLKGPRHREVLARLIVARGRVVPVERIVADLWETPPDGAVVAVRTFVAALRRAVEPDRAPRSPATVLVTKGPGYALRAAADAVDSWRFADGVNGAAGGSPAAALAGLDAALALWRGPAYADFAAAPWARAERSRLEELRLTAVERRAEALLALGRAADAVPDLDGHVAAHPWREDAWRLLALALYRTGRQADALAVVRRARTLLTEQLGVDPGQRLRRLETDLLRQSGALEADAVERVWAEAAAAYDQTVAAGARGRLESTVGLLRLLALTGGRGLEAAHEQRVAAIAAAERLGDPELTARVIGLYDVPGIWTRSDHPDRSAHVVAAAERALTGLGPGAGGSRGVRARLLATIAMESRGTRSPRPAQAAAEAERLARGLADPGLLAFALNARWVQTFQRAGLAPERDAIGAELVSVSATHGLPASEILGRLVRMQALSALGDFDGAEVQAAAADALARRHERPLVDVFTRWYRALRLAAEGGVEAFDEVEAAYVDAATVLEGAGMPGVERGLLPLALLCLRVWHDRPLSVFAEDTDWGPYMPWVRPLLLLAAERSGEAAEALTAAPEPPPDLLLEALWCLTGRAALLLGDRAVMARARTALAPATGELAGAGSGMLTVGPVALHVAALDTGLSRFGARGPA
ncbi:AfsR/SARP family transcriptional regulator [Jiangella mangrovi]|uniref:DNA-binding SARP family transcriptional activator n=1 Tax=Jiangella mangrovi TaxID=1524084 RepID=A0A7W9GPP3_9ACTN|nr:BTAD domain-containing putative transcriptional regulator [Jiangella mangrovi]MBB5787524.1 DNA-binding SARP family transcriptional activator [Jiangella mangrovi]